MTNEERARDPFDLLGLRRGATADEIKSAYRDMAKVWHPDRFAQDPRLQQKAQERLKEINEAYRRIIAGEGSTRAQSTTRDANEARGATYDSGRAARDARDERRDAHRTARAGDDSGHTRGARRDDEWRERRDDARDHARAARDDGARRKNVRPALAALVVFCATFALVTPRLLSSRSAKPPTGVDSPAAQQSQVAQPPESQQQPDEDSRQKTARAQRQSDATQRADSSSTQEVIAQPVATPVRALPTVSVVIDPSTNLLARADCPQRMRVTFPAGEEPRAYCDAHRQHADANGATGEENHADKSRLKSLAGRLASPSKWLSDKNSSDDSAKKPAPHN